MWGALSDERTGLYFAVQWHKFKLYCDRRSFAVRLGAGAHDQILIFFVWQFPPGALFKSSLQPPPPSFISLAAGRTLLTTYPPPSPPKVLTVLRSVAQCVSNRLTLLTHVPSTLKTEATRSFETLVFTRPTQRHIPEGGFLRRRGNIES
jgi:hypothetical protein